MSSDLKSEDVFFGGYTLNANDKFEKVTIPKLFKMKKKNQKIVMSTAYDFSFGEMLDQAGVDMILVGDTLGMVILGYDNTLPVRMEDVAHHTKAVVRGVKRALVVADMPFMSFHISIEKTIENAGYFIKECGASAVKIEGGERVLPLVEAMTKAEIPVMGHLGFTPQSIHRFGNYKVIGKYSEQAERLRSEARALQDAGAFSIVLECVPKEVAFAISKALDIPTIGIGSGNGCDGQVLVVYDFLGIYDKFTPKYLRKYANLREVIINAAQQYSEDVRSGNYPNEDESYSMPEKEYLKFNGNVKMPENR
ncbi:3-methyl-2-oxobutanoate hydroxymethyltransferase [bacterium]|nr:3-methyl-2-oxobutanoate hydroxymethyltransferase [bacterium]